MKMTKFVAVAAMTIASMGIVTGTAYAAPAPAAPAAVNWNVAPAGSQVVVSTTAGTLSNENNHLVVRDSSGALVDSVPLAFSADGLIHPVAAAIDGNKATLTTDMSPAAATPTPTYNLPGVNLVDLPAAVAAYKDNLTLTGAVGGFLGAAAGLATGCVLGGITGAAATGAVATLFGIGPLAGCIAGAIVLGSVASLAGTATGGVGAILANVGPFIQTLNAPPVKK